LFKLRQYKGYPRWSVRSLHAGHEEAQAKKPGLLF
jgi:hypothetical protein